MPAHPQTVAETNRRSRLTRTHLIVISLMMIASATALAVRAKGWFVHAANSDSHSIINAQGTPVPRIDALYFRVTASGIEPAELTIPKGRYLVAIDNSNGFEAVEINIDKDNGQRSGKAVHSPGKRKWKDFVEFTPGSFTLSDPANPKRVSHLTITNK